MTRSAQPLGDSHNFGRRVSLRAGRIVKPRSVRWEWLVLSSKSPLRRLLAQAAASDELGRGAFDFLPDLEFHAMQRDGAEVEPVALTPLPKKLPVEQRRQLAKIVGRSLSLWSWLGVADLHWENLALGIGARGQLVFTPLDVEMILADFARPTETKLLPDADPEYAEICRHAAGVRRVLPYLGKPVAAADLVSMAAAYLETLAFLERHASAIAKCFAELPELHETPIRVCLRGTEEYVHTSAELWPPLLDAELEQLARGDIPYFFRLYGRRGIHYYSEPSLTQLAKIPLAGDVPQLDPLLRLSRGLRSATRARLRAEGLFTLLGAFDHASYSGKQQADGLEVTFAARRLLVKTATSDEFSSRRNLGAFVGSVYLPCQCGEVRTVLVPAVTRCSAASGTSGVPRPPSR